MLLSLYNQASLHKGEDKNFGGRMSQGELNTAVRDGTIDTVIVAMTDLQGRLIGKRLTGRFFLETECAPQLFCDYLLATDIEMELVPGFEAASWSRGYGDFALVPDMATLRAIPWLPGTALVLADVADKAGTPLAHSPRQMLKRQIERLAQLGYYAEMAAELEFYLLDETYADARSKGYRDLKLSSWYPEDGHIFQTTKDEPFIRLVRNMMDQADIPIEGSKAEWSAGQQEINLKYAEALEMADRLAIYKNGVKELAHLSGKAVSFMAKPAADLAGNSFHMHLSLRRKSDGASAFHDRDMPDGMSTLFRSALAGSIRNSSAATLFYAPYVNSYRRFRPGTFAPTRLAWSHDNRTTAFRVIGTENSLRFECRVPGADVNPYVAFAALLAGSIEGIENQAVLSPELKGDAYAANGIATIATSLGAALAEAEHSKTMREAFGRSALGHYIHAARWELAEFEKTVTEWEKIRYFERS